MNGRRKSISRRRSKKSRPGLPDRRRCLPRLRPAAGKACGESVPVRALPPMARIRSDSPPLFEVSCKPDFSVEEKAIAQGLWPLAGADEAGRGPLAGPVVAAAVILDPKNIPEGLDDSKRLSAETRETLFAEILRTAIGVSVVSISAAGIDRINILQGEPRSHAPGNLRAAGAAAACAGRRARRAARPRLRLRRADQGATSARSRSRPRRSSPR